MAYCMDGVTGDVRHEDYRDADYEVQRSEAFASSSWCRECLAEYIGSGMGSCLESVTTIAPVPILSQIKHQNLMRQVKRFGATVY